MIPIPVFSCNNGNHKNLLTTYVVECFDEENALCQIKTNVSVTCLCLCFLFSFLRDFFCNNGESFIFYHAIFCAHLHND